MDTETGESKELRLEHREEAEKFYHGLAAQGMKVRVGMEASGHARWFERLLAELHFELWIGDGGKSDSFRLADNTGVDRHFLNHGAWAIALKGEQSLARR